MEEIKMINIKELHEFKNHPFKVVKNAEMDELKESIENDGVILQEESYPDRLEKVKNKFRGISDLQI